MALDSYPFDGQPTTESQYSRLFRGFAEGVYAVQGTSNKLEVSANSTGMNVQVRPGFAVVRGHAFYSTAIETLTVSASTAQPRIDTVVLRLDPDQNSVKLVVKPGTPAASPVAPTLTITETGIYEFPLANVAVNASVVTIASDKVTDRRVLSGDGLRSWTTAGRPAATGMGYTLGYNTTLKQLESNVAGSWQSINPTVDWSSLTGKPSSFTPADHTHKWSAIADKPSSFTPAAHSHTWSAITDKPSTFTPATHTHAWSAITGKPSIAAADHDHQAIKDSAGNYLKVASDSVGPRVYSNAIYKRTYTLASAAKNRLMVITDGDTLGALEDKAVISGYRMDAYGPSSEAYAHSVSGSAYYSVWMSSSGRFGRNTSSRRYKDNINPAVIDIDAVLALEPVTYHRKNTPDDHVELGLIAEDSVGVEHLVVYDVERDEDGQPVEGALPRPETVRYETALPVQLLAVVKAQHERIEALEAEAAEMDAWASEMAAGMTELTARLDALAAS